jgi:hypothetical protein
VSDESEKLIDDVFMQKVGVKYPFIRASGVNQKYNIKFFPSVYCIAPDGTILTVPEDRVPAEDFIEKQLQNVTLSPKMPDDSRFDVLRSMWEKRDHSRLADYLEKMLAQDNLDGELRTVYAAQRDELHKRMDREQARIAELAKGPDYGAAVPKLERIAKDWKNLPPSEAAESELQRFSKDPAIKKELVAAKALDRMVEKTDMSKKSQRHKLVDDLMKFGKRYGGTFAASKAEQLRSSLMEQGDD